MATDSLFFRVEHDLLRSEAFQTLGGSAIKVYLVIGLYADFSTGWAYPSIRTIAKQAGISRQTVLTAIGELTRVGLLATSKSRGRSTAYKVVRGEPARTSGKREVEKTRPGVPEFLGGPPQSSTEFLGVGAPTSPDSLGVAAHFFGPPGPARGPEREPRTREDAGVASIPIPGTPFRLSAEGRLLVAVDLQGLLKERGIPARLAERLAAQKDPESVAKVLLNALYLESLGKLQNGPGYIRAGIEDGYELLPQVATKLEGRRRELETQLKSIADRREVARRVEAREDEEAAVNLLIESLPPYELQELVDKAVAALPGPITRRNPTLSNPFVRGKVYELAGGEPLG